MDPEGGYHESMDYMRITWAPLALMAELRRTSTREDPARRLGVFRSMGPTYIYKVLPDGSTARDDGNEFPCLDAVDKVLLSTGGRAAGRGRSEPRAGRAGVAADRGGQRRGCDGDGVEPKEWAAVGAPYGYGERGAAESGGARWGVSGGAHSRRETRLASSP